MTSASERFDVLGPSIQLSRETIEDCYNNMLGLNMLSNPSTFYVTVPMPHWWPANISPSNRWLKLRRCRCGGQTFHNRISKLLRIAFYCAACGRRARGRRSFRIEEVSY